MILIIFNKIPKLLGLNIVFGVFSSIINHGLTEEWAKWIDRMMMFFGAIIDCFYIIKIFWESGFIYILNSLLILAIISYFSAKQILLLKEKKKITNNNNNNNSNIPHLFAHIFLSILHYIFILTIEKECELNDIHYNQFLCI